MTAYEFRSRMNNDICTMLDRLYQSDCRGIVNDQRNSCFMCNIRDSSKVRNVQFGFPRVSAYMASFLE